MLILFIPVSGMAAQPLAGGDGPDIDKIRDQIGIAEKELERLESRRTQASHELQRVEDRHRQIAMSLQQMKDTIQLRAEQAAILRRRTTEASQQVIAHNQSLISLARSAYIAGNREWLQLLLMQDDVSELMRTQTYYGYVQRTAQMQLQNLQDALAAIAEATAKADEETQRLQTLRNAVATEQQRLDSLRGERYALLARLDREHHGKGAELHQLKDTESRLQSLLGSMRSVVSGKTSATPDSRGFVAARKQMAWPVAGEVAERYGAPRMSSQWDGVVINAAEGTPVRSVYAGRIVYADWLKGYGLLTIIDHGNGYLSLYAFNHSVTRSVGDAVDAGSIIATVGSSGDRAESGLYFGIREKGKPVDPALWCAD